MCPRAGLDGFAKRNISCACQYWALDCPAHSLLLILTMHSSGADKSCLNDPVVCSICILACAQGIWYMSDILRPRSCFTGLVCRCAFMLDGMHSFYVNFFQEPSKLLWKGLLYATVATPFIFLHCEYDFCLELKTW